MGYMLIIELRKKIYKLVTMVIVLRNIFYNNNNNDDLNKS